jgi:DNA-binding NtrC family response regulator
MRPSVLVVDDQPQIRDLLAMCLEHEGYGVVTVGTGAEAVARLTETAVHVVIADIVLPDIDGLEVLRRARVLAPRAPVILVTAYATVETAVEALRTGAADYVAKPFRIDDLIARVQRLVAGAVLDHAPHNGHPREPPWDTELVGGGGAIQALRARISRVAAAGSDVLVTGETGTGKELVARALHAQSARRAGPLIPVNCAAIPEGLFESALLGHARGAFTSAVHAYPGLVCLADRGTLFLDEVGELPLALQAKLLRVIEDREVWSMGRSTPVRVDCRIVASTNRDLRRDVAAGRFRADLYYRLNVVSIGLAPLRDRREDIPRLVEHFIHRLNRKLSRHVRGVTPEAWRALVDHDWPGNVRELLHVVEGAMVSAGADVVTLEDLPVEMQLTSVTPSLKEATRRFERHHIRDMLARTEFDKKEAARRLGLSLASLYRKLEGEARAEPPSRNRAGVEPGARGTENIVITRPP